MGLRITAGKQRAIAVRNIHFREQGARAGIDGLRCTHHFPFEFLAGVLSELEKCA